MTWYKVKVKVTTAWKPLKKSRPSVPHGTNFIHMYALTCWQQFPIYQSDWSTLYASLYCGHFHTTATQISQWLYHEHGRQTWSCFDQQTYFVVNWKCTCLIQPRDNSKPADLPCGALLVSCYHTVVLRAIFRDHPGEPVPEENFWTYGARED